jgi:hypothetical protein
LLTLAEERSISTSPDEEAANLTAAVRSITASRRRKSRATDRTVSKFVGLKGREATD